MNFLNFRKLWIFLRKDLANVIKNEFSPDAYIEINRCDYRGGQGNGKSSSTFSKVDGKLIIDRVGIKNILIIKDRALYTELGRKIISRRAP